MQWCVTKRQCAIWVMSGKHLASFNGEKNRHGCEDMLGAGKADGGEGKPGGEDRRELGRDGRVPPRLQVQPRDTHKLSRLLHQHGRRRPHRASRGRDRRRRGQIPLLLRRGGIHLHRHLHQPLQGVPGLLSHLPRHTIRRHREAAVEHTGLSTRRAASALELDRPLQTEPTCE